MSDIRKDGKAYDSGDVSIDILGAEAFEITDISYSSKQDHQRNYAIGNNRAVTWSQGKVEHECSLTIAMTEGIQFESIAPNGDLMQIPPFEINVSYTNDFNVIVNDTIICKFQSQGREVTGEMGLKYKYDMFVLDIIYNNA